jgi:hypothetical protein
MFKFDQKPAFEPDKVIPLEKTGKEDKLGITPKIKPAKIYPFVRPEEKESLEEGFLRQDITLISNNEIVGAFHRGFPTKIVVKDRGVYEIWEQKPTGLKVHVFKNIDEIKTG